MKKSIPTTRSRPTARCLLGAHLSIAGGMEKAVYRAAALDCTALQVFTKNANTWKERNLTSSEIDRFAAAIAHTGIRFVAAHTSYLINIATPDKKQRKRSSAALQQELIRANQLQISGVVLHPGSHKGAGEDRGLDLAADSLKEVLSLQPRNGAKLLLETTAGQGNSLGHRFGQLATLIDRVEDKSKIGVCLDTAHIFAAGYDIRSEAACRKVIQQFDGIIGLKYLKLLHLNDSRKDLGTRVDRHEHIGSGYIGLEAFRCLMRDSRLAEVPKIIETPKDSVGDRWDRKNLDRLRALLYER